MTWTIIGLGSAGCRVATHLREQLPDVTVRGVDAERAPMIRALNDGLIDEAHEEAPDAIAEASFIVLTVPVAAALSLLEGLRDRIPEQAALLVESIVWAPVLEHLEELRLRERATVGRIEQRKTESGDAPLLLRLAQRQPGSELPIVEQLRDTDGLEILSEAASEHDRRVALEEQLPYLMQQALARGSGAPASAEPPSESFRQGLLANRSVLLDESAAFSRAWQHVRGRLIEDDLDAIAPPSR